MEYGYRLWDLNLTGVFIPDLIPRPKEWFDPDEYQLERPMNLSELSNAMRELYENEINQMPVPERGVKKLYDPMKFSHKWLKPGRRCGNTTRQADRCIQALFKGKKVRMIDHHLPQNAIPNGRINHLEDIIIRRLNMEHRIDAGRILIDRMHGTMELT